MIWMMMGSNECGEQEGLLEFWPQSEKSDFSNRNESSSERTMDEKMNAKNIHLSI